MDRSNVVSRVRVRQGLAHEARGATGGTAPAADCTTSTPGIDEAVDFTANYYFYVGGSDAGN